MALGAYRNDYVLANESWEDWLIIRNICQLVNDINHTHGKEDRWQCFWLPKSGRDWWSCEKR